jgi:putative hydrolase of the HAD superfamily
MVAIYRTHTPSIELLPDARDALKDLKAVCPIAVITDGPVVSQSRKAEALGIDSIASPVILTELMGSDYRKPHPRAFEQIARDFGSRTFVYIADNPLKDFKAPRNLGWKTIRIRRHGSLHFDIQSSELLTEYELLDCSRLVDILKGI